MSPLRAQFLEQLKQANRSTRGKALVAKAENAPVMVAVRNNAGEITDFLQGERYVVSEDEIKSMTSKSAPVHSDNDNTVFDDLFNFTSPTPQRVQVEKSAEDSASELFSNLFPSELHCVV